MSHKLTILPYLIKHTPKVSGTNFTTLKGTFNIYAFDLDHTLIEPKTPGSRFAKTADDWKFMSFSSGRTTLDRLQEIVHDDPSAQVVIFSNQGGVLAEPPNSRSCTKYTEKVELILKEIARSQDGEKLLERLWIYASPKIPASLSSRRGKTRKVNMKQSLLVKKTKSLKVSSISVQDTIEDSCSPLGLFGKMRKPEVGMMEQFKKDLQARCETPPELTLCHYCGDAAGRPSDFSDSDRVFARNLSIPFKTPEELFH